MGRGEEMQKERLWIQGLDWPTRILIFFTWSGILGAFLAVCYDRMGFKRKASDSWITAGVSIAAHVVWRGLIYLMS